MVRTGVLVLGLALGGVVGCSSQREEQIEIKAPTDPLANAKAVVQRYADGQPMSSEVTMFPQMIDTVRKADPAKADVLEKGLTEIQNAAPDARADLAKKLLNDLQ